MISNLEVKKTYVGNGTTRNWPIPFSYTDTSQIKVKLTVNGAETLVPSTDYTVDTVAQNIIYPKTADPIPATTKITLYRETAKTQATDLTNQGALYPETLEASLDRLTEIVQEQAEAVSRAVKTQISSSTSPDELMAELNTNAAAAVAAAATATASESSAGTSAAAASASQTAAAGSAAAALSSQTSAATSETNAAGSATAAAGSAAAAAASQTSAATSETNAAGSAAAALTSKTAAATSETNAAASQTAAAASQASAAASAAAAQASADTSNNYAGVVNCILRGLKISAVNGFSVSVDSGVVLANEVRKAVSAGSVTLSARKAALIYADNTGALGKVDAKYPTDYIDNNTVGMWIFNKSGNIPNSAVGLSSIAVANDLVPSGTIAIVDGQADYAAKLDGTSGCYASQNYTGFPSGTAEFEETLGFRPDKLGAESLLFNIGTAATSSRIKVYMSPTGKILVNNYTASDYDTGFVVSTGTVYALTVAYSSGYLYVMLNGVPLIPATAISLSMAQTVLNVGAYSGPTTPASITLMYFELRNKMRPAATTAAISNKLLLPNFYTKSTGVYPTIPSAYAATYHEYRMDETSGTAVADSNTSAALNGTATGTTIVDSDLALGKARKFNGTSSDKITFGSFACGSQFSWAGVITPTGSGLQMLWSNRSSTSAGNVLYLSDNNLMLRINSTVYTLLAGLAMGEPVFVGVSIDGTAATVYIARSVAAVIAVIGLNTTASTAYMGYDVEGLYLTGTSEYILFGNFALTQSDMQQIYTALMKTGRRSIADDVLTADQSAVAYVKTSSNGVTDYNDLWPCYGRREGTTGGNRRMFLGWKPFSGATYLKWENPFGSPKYKKEVHWAQDAKGTNEVQTSSRINDSYGNVFGVQPIAGNASYNDAQSAAVFVGASGATNFNGTWRTSGYLGMYVELIEDFVGVQ